MKMRSSRQRRGHVGGDKKQLRGDSWTTTSRRNSFILDFKAHESAIKDVKFVFARHENLDVFLVANDVFHLGFAQAVVTVAKSCLLADSELPRNLLHLSLDLKARTR
jgi:hypothetical protein